MTLQTHYVQTTAQGIEELKIGGSSGIFAPFYAPEVKGSEDFEVLLDARAALEPNNPVFVPGYRWKDLRSQPKFKEARPIIREFVSNHPIAYYEPVDLLRYSRPRNLVTYAFQGSRRRARKFNERLRAGEFKAAIEMLPTFFQPFVERGFKRLLDATENAPDPNLVSLPGNQGRIYEAWTDPRADRGYPDYFEQIVEDAAKSPNSLVIPPTPPILKSSGHNALGRTMGVNRYMRKLCGSVSSRWPENEITSYYHIYIDQRAVDTSLAVELLQRLETELEEAASFEDEAGYTGVAVTISNYDRAWDSNRETTVEKFVNRVTNIARQNYLPLVLPRSGRYGLHLTDDGVHGFSSLMNGNPTYNQRSSGGISREAMYGTVALYGEAVDVNIEDLIPILSRNNGRVHPIQGIPDSPPTFNPGQNGIDNIFGPPTDFRVKFGKRRRLVHVQEAREMKDGIKNGVTKPARRYLERSRHPLLS